jgi:ribosome recycling factor
MTGLIDDLKKRMQSALDLVLKEFSGLRTGRASTALLEPIHVDAYGSSMPLSQVGTISVVDSRLLAVQVWDKSMAKVVEKAIRDAGLGLNPQGDGTTIRVPLPELSQDRRKELAKIAAKYAEQGRVAVRNVRREGMDMLKKQEKDKVISEDDMHRISDEVQKITDDYIKKVDEALSHKEKDILQV